MTNGWGFGLPSKQRILVCLTLAKCHRSAITAINKRTPKSAPTQINQVEAPWSLAYYSPAAVVSLEEVVFDVIFEIFEVELSG